MKVSFPAAGRRAAGRAEQQAGERWVAAGRHCGDRQKCHVRACKGGDGRCGRVGRGGSHVPERGLLAAPSARCSSCSKTLPQNQPTSTDRQISVPPFPPSPCAGTRSACAPAAAVKRRGAAGPRHIPPAVLHRSGGGCLRGQALQGGRTEPARGLECPARFVRRSAAAKTRL